MWYTIFTQHIITAEGASAPDSIFAEHPPSSDTAPGVSASDFFGQATAHDSENGDLFLASQLFGDAPASDPAVDLFFGGQTAQVLPPSAPHSDSEGPYGFPQSDQEYGAMGDTGVAATLTSPPPPPAVMPPATDASSQQNVSIGVMGSEDAATNNGGSSGPPTHSVSVDGPDTETERAAAIDVPADASRTSSVPIGPPMTQQSSSAAELTQLLKEERERMQTVQQQQQEIMMQQFQQMMAQMQNFATVQSNASHVNHSSSADTNSISTNAVQLGADGESDDALVKMQAEKELLASKRLAELKAAEEAAKKRMDLELRLAELKRLEDERTTKQLEEQLRMHEEALARGHDEHTHHAQHTGARASRGSEGPSELGVLDTTPSTDFVQYFTDEGLPYYHNIVTAATVWEPPACWLAVHNRHHHHPTGLYEMDADGGASAVSFGAPVSRGPPLGPYTDDGVPDMRYKRNQLWYTSQGIYPEDERYGQNIDLDEHTAESHFDLDEQQLLDSFASTEPPRVPTPPPRLCHPVVSWGFGGKLLVMFPEMPAGAPSTEPLVLDNGDDAEPDPRCSAGEDAADVADEGAAVQASAMETPPRVFVDDGSAAASPEPGASGDDGNADAGDNVTAATPGAPSTAADDDQGVQQPVEGSDDDFDDGGGGDDDGGAAAVDGDISTRAQWSVEDALPGVVRVFDVHDIVQHHDRDLAQLRLAYPGPLDVVELVQVDDVVRFTDAMAVQCPTQSERVLWRLLGLLCRNNGLVRGSTRVNQAQNNDKIVADVVHLLCEFSTDTTVAPAVAAAANAQRPQPSTAVVRELQILVASGRKHAACNLAVEHALWDHALILARKIGDGVYSDVLAKFAAATATVATPALASLYALYAGVPAGDNVALGAAAAEGAWTEALAVLLSNPTAGDTATLLGLGDTLHREHADSCAAHVCYLCADETPGSRWTSTPRIELVGSAIVHRRALRVDVASFRRTEILEYAKRLRSEAPQHFEHFYVYRYLYAELLAEAGMVDAAARYGCALMAALKSAGTATLLAEYPRGFVQILLDFCRRMRWVLWLRSCA